MFFRKKNKPAPASIGEEQKDAKAEIVQPEEKAAEGTRPEVIYIYNHGFTSGVYKIEPEADTFHQFLKAANDLDRISEEKRNNELQLQALRQQEISERTAKQLNQEILMDSKNQLNRVLDEQAALLAIKAGKEKKQEDLHKRRESIEPEYSWFPALLYLVAGLVFITGEVYITHQLTGWGYAMKGLEAWMFAAGLSCTAFLVKPLFDRLLEKVFQQSGFQLKRIYTIVLIGIALTGLTMLYFMGSFRSEAQAIQQELMADSGGDEMDDNDDTEVAKQVEANKKLNDSFAGQAGMILSSLIFAIGGALGLSIAINSLVRLQNRYWLLPWRIQILRSHIRKLNTAISRLNDEACRLRIAMDKAEEQWRANRLEMIEASIKELEQQRNDLLRAWYDVKTEKEQYLYFDGKNRGQKYQLEGDLRFRILELSDFPGGGNQPGAGADKEQMKEARIYSRRPFVKIRKMIADNYSKSQNNYTHDGTEFEIVN